MFTPGGATVSVHVPASCRVANSSFIAFSHNGQSGQPFASVSVHGLKASSSLISASIQYLSVKSAAMIHSACPSPSKTSLGGCLTTGGNGVGNYTP